MPGLSFYRPCGLLRKFGWFRSVQYLCFLHTTCRTYFNSVVIRVVYSSLVFGKIPSAKEMLPKECDVTMFMCSCSRTYLGSDATQSTLSSERAEASMHISGSPTTTYPDSKVIKYSKKARTELKMCLNFATG